MLGKLETHRELSQKEAQKFHVSALMLRNWSELLEDMD
jgi:hypothetical protein